MLTPDFDFDDVVNKRIDNFVFKKNKRIAMALHYVGVEFADTAKMRRTFTTRTGNLLASIGYVVLLNGKVIDGMLEGEVEGITACTSLIAWAREEFKDEGYALVGFAGMEYAAAVESKGYDVITGSTPMASDLLDYFKKELELT